MSNIIELSSVNNGISLVEKLKENNFAFLFVSIFMVLDVCIHKYFSIEIQNITFQWLLSNINMGYVVIIIVLIVIYFHVIAPIIIKGYNYCLIRLLRNYYKEQDKKTSENPKYVYIGFVKQYAALIDNHVLHELVKEKEREIDNWNRDREIIITFSIISIFYLLDPSPTLKTTLLNSLGNNIYMLVGVYLSLGFLLLKKLQASTIDPPKEYIYILNYSRAKEIVDLARGEVN